MQKELFINEEAFQKKKDKEIGRMHTQLVMLLLFFIIYYVVGFFVVNSLFLEQETIIKYVVQATLEACIWCVSGYVLWKGKVIGRRLMLILSFISFYSIYQMYLLFQYPFVEGIDKIICIVFIILFICKCITGMMFSISLYQAPYSYIWQRFEKEGKEAREHDEALIQQIMQVHSTPTNTNKQKRNIQKHAIRYLRQYLIVLIVLLYGSLLAFYLFMGVIRSVVSVDAVGLAYVQRYNMLGSLYTALVWSLSAILIFLNNPKARLTMLAACALEVIRFAYVCENTINIFQSQQYGVASILCILIIEFIRYAILLRYVIMFFKNPYIKAYWKWKQLQDKS